ncbi:MAG: exodeoxyribonuclease V subunit gamma, partial [Acidimicrobiales bacterium]
MAEPDRLDLPARVSLFGLTRLPASYLDVLRAIASARDTHLFLLHPSPALWDRVATAGSQPRLIRRRDDQTASLPRHPLLATWGRDAREMQVVLAAGVAEADRHDIHHSLEPGPPTLLGRIQADIRADRVPPGPPAAGQPDRRHLVGPADRSLQVHSCHGRARQVEVVRDAIAHLLAGDSTLEPRDVIVMCPDIETFAPLVHATFGTVVPDTAAGGPAAGGYPTRPRPPELRVRLADRSLRQTNPILAVVAEVLALPASRVRASQLLDLASREPVRRRFGFDDDDLARLEEWVAAAGIRWGLDRDHRAAYGLGALEANTWRSGLDRLLVGVAVPGESLALVGGVLPVDDVDSGDIDLAGRLAELVERVQAAARSFSRPAPVAAWA